MDLSEKLIEFMRNHIEETFKENAPTKEDVIDMLYEVNVFTVEFIEDSNYYLKQGD